MAFHDLSEASLGGISIGYRTAGDPAAPPILLLHAFGTTSLDWVPVVNQLAQSHRIIAPDARGHGRSQWAGPYSLDVFRDDVLGLIEALSLAGLTLIGHSIGGIVAALVAETPPDALQRLIIEDVAIPAPNAPAMQRRPRAATSPDVDPALGAAIAEQLVSPDPSWWHASARIAVPTLLLAGGPESHIDQKRIAALATRIPHARLVTIPVGHRIHTTRPVEFVGAVQAFLADERRQ